jgi:hypothetical protein
MKEPLKTFVAYAREDRVLKEQLVAGDAWNDTIHENIDAAGIFILLISDDFLRSDYCFNTEMQLALRGEAEDTAIVAPVILKECAWHTTELAAIQVLPSEGKPEEPAHGAMAPRLRVVRMEERSRGSPDGAERPGLIALDALSGEVEWRLPFDNGANGVNWFDGRLFAGDVGGDLWCVRARDGHLLWRCSLGEPLFSRSLDACK